MSGLLSLLTLASLSISVAMYVPLWTRILRRKSTADFSKTAYWMIFSLQVIHLVMATLQRAHYLAAIYVLHSIFVGFTIFLIYRYYERGQP